MKKINENNANRFIDTQKKLQKLQSYICSIFPYFYNKNKALIYFKVIWNYKHFGLILKIFLNSISHPMDWNQTMGVAMQHEPDQSLLKFIL